MKLINTIEINPYDYANVEYETPKGSAKEMPKEWDEFWRKCLSDKQLGNLNAIQKGSYLVNITTIKDQQLETIIQQELGEIDINDYEEQVSPICGGIVLKIDEDIIIQPNCCGDIGNIQEWEGIFETDTQKWTQLWIGHPWIFYKRTNGIIEFSDY